MKQFVRKSILPGVLAALAAGLIFLPAELRNHSRHLTGFEQNKANLAIHRKLPGLARKAASAEWFMHQRTYGLGYIPQDAEIRAVEDVRMRMMPALQAQQGLQKSTAAALNWGPHGPGNIGGRLRGLVVHPNNPSILYVGSVSGGVWKSTNGGASWTPTMNDLITLNISALATKPGDPNTLYAGTGEAFFTADCLPGRGLLKTTDGGNTWKRVHVAQGLNSPFITAIAVSPANPNVVYAAGRQAAPQLNVPAESVPDPGVSAIFKSTDSGETWQDVTTGKGIDHNPQSFADNFATDVVASSADANVVYATFGLVAAGGIWKSTNAGQTWSRLTAGLPDPSLPNLGYTRIKLAMAPSNPNVLYASFAYAKKDGDTVNLKDQALLGVWKTINAGQSWTQLTTPLTINQRNRDSGNTTALGSQGSYANALIVHPSNPDVVFLAGLDIYKSMDGGKTWSQVSMWIPPGSPANPENLPFVHADHHVFAFDLSTNPPTLYNGSDGGIARSRDLGTTWDILNHDLGVTQFYYFAAHPTDSNIMFGGAQDNGTPMVMDGALNAWSDVTSGDGGPSHFDLNNPNTIYASVYGVNIFRAEVNYATKQFTGVKEIGFTNGANGITEEDVKGADFFAPFEPSPNSPSLLVLGTNRLLRSVNRGDSWTALTNPISVPIVSVAIAEGNDNIIWVATDEAKVYKTEDNGGSFANVTGANLPNRFVTDIEFDPSNNRTVYLTYSGYGTPHVFKSTNAGANWADVTHNLPDAPANTIQVHPQNPNQLFLGTDVGVFISEDGGQTWQPSANNFPTVQVVAIQIKRNTNRIYAATHGRGVYSAELSGSGAAVLHVTANEVSIQTRPNQIGSANFTIANTGGAELSFSITASGGQANSFVGSASLPRLPAPFGKMLPAVQHGISFPNGLIQAEQQAGAKQPPSEAPAQMAIKRTPRETLVKLETPFALVQPFELQGSDVLVLDDGNNAPDDFIGEGPNSFNDFYWMNQFDLAHDFQLEAVQVYLRTEGQNSNTLEIAALDGNFQDLVRGNVNLSPSPNGEWFTIRLTNPLRFKAGDRFYLEIGASYAIPYPAGADRNAQTPNRSYHYNWSAGRYDALGTVSGFANGAYLIRASGIKSGGNANRLAATPASGTIAPGSAQTINVTFDAQDLDEGDYRGQLSITSNGGNKTIPVRIRVSSTAGVDDEVSELPETFALAQNYPNPFNPETQIMYQLPEPAQVELAVYDLTGRLVVTLMKGMKNAGQHAAIWNGQDYEDRAVTSGVYLYRLTVTTRSRENFSVTKKMTLLR